MQGSHASSQVQPQDTEDRAYRGLDRITVITFKESEVVESRNLRCPITSDPEVGCCRGQWLSNVLGTGCGCSVTMGNAEVIPDHASEIALETSSR